ncbi:MAG: hypothetical protein HYY09_07540 [Firmicutes bacterium]|nr:hypothetical protein [Bacillota bacterium]
MLTRNRKFRIGSMQSWILILILLLVPVLLIGCKKKEEATKPVLEQPKPEAPKVELGELVPTLTLVGPSEAWTPDQFEANRLIIQTWEKELGLKVDHKAFADYATLISNIAPGKRETIDVISFGYIERASRVDPDELLSRPFLCKADANYGEYCNQAYDDLVKNAKAALDKKERQKLVHQAQEILGRDLPAIVQFHPTSTSIYNKNAFTDVVVVPAGGTNNVWNWTQARPLTGDKVLKYGTQQVTRSIHPMNHVTFSEDVIIAQMVYDTLTRMAPDGSVVPWLATDWQMTDSNTLRVKLRQGVKFHDGKPLTADDVKFTYDYLKRWEIGGYLNDLKPVESVTVIDPYTVDFKLPSPSATILTLTLGQIPIIPKHVWDGIVEKKKLSHPREWSDAPIIGSGQYQFESQQTGVGLRLVRNPDHWEPTVPDAFELRLFHDARSVFNALLNQSVYFVSTVSTASAAEIEEAQKKPFLEIAKHQSVTTRFMQFNLRDQSPTANYAFRLALSQTIDYKTIVDVILKGYGVPGAGFIAPGNPFWHNPNVKWPEFDIAKAKQTLKDAGYSWDSEGRLHFPKDYQAKKLPN